MKIDRFFDEMEKAYYTANPLDKDNIQCKDFIVENKTSYYEVDCSKYKEITDRR